MNTSYGKGNKYYTMRLSFNIQSYGTFIIFGISFHSSQHAGDVVLLQLCMNFVPLNTQIQKFSKVNKGGEHSFTYNKGCLKVSYMCMTCHVCALHTNRKRFRHISEGRTDKYLRKIKYVQPVLQPLPLQTKFHIVPNQWPCDQYCLSVVACCQNKLNSAVRF